MNEKTLQELQFIKSSLPGLPATSNSVDIKDYLKLREILALERIADSLKSIEEMYKNAD